MSDGAPRYGQPGGSTFPLTTAFTFAEHELDRDLGTVFGVVVRSVGVARGIGASLKALAGGEVGQYTALVEDTRRHALDRLIENAQVLGAHGLIGVRFDSSDMGQGLTEVVAYGTAVTFKA
jgi:uncharacterized protein YbjQ (UPF0145 family)